MDAGQLPAHLARSRGGGPPAGQLALQLLELERDPPLRDKLETAGRLRRIAGETGGEFARLIAECVAEILFSKRKECAATLYREDSDPRLLVDLGLEGPLELPVRVLALQEAGVADAEAFMAVVGASS